jgi:hypothetical protein
MNGLKGDNALGGILQSAQTDRKLNILQVVRFAADSARFIQDLNELSYRFQTERCLEGVVDVAETEFRRWGSGLVRISSAKDLVFIGLRWRLFDRVKYRKLLKEIRRTARIKTYHRVSLNRRFRRCIYFLFTIFLIAAA